MPEQNTSNQISIEVDANPMKPVRNRWDIKTPEISTEVAIFEASTTVSLYMQEFPDSIGNGLFCKSVEINDLKHRFALMNKANQDQVNKDTGAFMSVRGRYYPDKALATPLEPPLTMDIKATSQDQLNLAMKHVQNIIDDAQKSAFAVKGFDVRFANGKVDIGVEQDSGFNVKARVVGPGGAYIKHIQSATGAKLSLKGRGSGNIDPSLGTEDDLPLFIHIQGINLDQVKAATELANSLVETVRLAYKEFKTPKALPSAMSSYQPTPALYSQPQYQQSGAYQPPTNVPPPPMQSYQPPPPMHNYPPPPMQSYQSYPTPNSYPPPPMNYQNVPPPIQSYPPPPMNYQNVLPPPMQMNIPPPPPNDDDRPPGF